MIIAGAIMMVIGFFGCFGAIRESQCLLIGFFVLLLLVLTLCIAIIAIVFANPHLTDSVAKPVRLKDKIVQRNLECIFRCVRQERISKRGSVRPSVTPVQKPRFSAVFGHSEILH